MLLSRRLQVARILSVVFLLFFVVCDAMGARRGVRVDFLAWADETPIDSCPGFAFSYYVLNLENVRFHTSRTLGINESWIDFSYCQDSIPWSEGLDVFEYLNREVFFEDESVLANEIGSNDSVNEAENVTARKYSFLNEFGFGYQWTFYDFPDNLTLVGYYDSDLDQSPRIESADGSVTLWDSDYDGEYFCFESGVFTGVSDGSTFCEDPSVSASERDALVALYNSTNGDNWLNNENWLKGDPCQNNWFGVTCRKLEVGESEQLAAHTVTRLDLGDNNLVGNLPGELGNLTNLNGLYLNSNILTGLIPGSLANLELALLSLGWNGLQTNDGFLDSFLDDADDSGDWSVTQTIPPDFLVITGIEPTSISLAWQAIEYTGDTGRYRVWFSTAPGGPFVDGGVTDSKLDTTHTLTGLTSGVPYYVVVRSETDNHDNNQNDIVSADSRLLFTRDVVLIDGFE